MSYSDLTTKQKQLLEVLVALAARSAEDVIAGSEPGSGLYLLQIAATDLLAKAKVIAAEALDLKEAGATPLEVMKAVEQKVRDYVESRKETKQ
jgi:hypothetical protein